MSDDGIRFATAGLFEVSNGDETAFLFEEDGAVIAIMRRGSGTAEICRAWPPYQKWDRKDRDRYIGGPVLVKWNGYYLVGGRKKTNENIRRTVFYWLKNDHLFECAELPSAGDNSYPGFVELSPKRAMVSYYSSHEKDEAGKPITAIYLAILEIEK